MGLLSNAFKSGGGGADYSQAISAIQGVKLPSVEEMRIQLTDLVSSGEITPEQAENILQEASAFEGMELDPYTREAQMKSLQQLQEIGDAEGLDPIAKAKMLEAQEQMETSGRGMREAGMQRAQERGIGGSGLELANQLLGDQASAGRASRDATMAAAEAQRRGLEAITMSGQLGGQIRGQDYSQEANKAQAIDAINRFNTMTRQNTQESNIGRRQQANYANLGERQRLSDYNTAAGNQNRQRDADLIQQNFQNNLSKQNALANIYGQQANAEAASRASDRSFVGGLIGTGATVLGGMYGGPMGAAAAGGVANAATGGGGGGGSAGGYQNYNYSPQQATGPRVQPQPNQNIFSTQGFGGNMIQKKKTDLDPYGQGGF